MAASRLKARMRLEGRACGFALPSVLIMSIILLAIGVSTLQVGAAITRTLIDQHWERLAKANAQSGVSFVASCVKQYIITWSSALAPNIDCNEAAVVPARDIYLTSDLSADASPSRWRSTYTISPPVTGSDGARRVQIVGKVEILSPDNVVVKTYTWPYNTLLGSRLKVSNYKAGYFNSCAITTNQQVYCTGDNGYGQLGDGTTITRLTPTRFQLPAGKKAQSMKGGDNTCVITIDQLVYCAGYNTSGHLGDGTTVNRSTPVLFQLPAGKKALSLTDGTNVCVVTTDQLVYCAGYNARGQLGNGNTTNQSIPVLFILPAGKKAATATNGGEAGCVLTTDQLAYCAGYNTNGQLGDGSTTHRSTPVLFPLPAGKKAASINVGNLTGCALTTDQLVYCAGDNTFGQLGDGTITNRLSPVLFILPGGKKAKSLTTGSYNTCALTTDQLVYCAGYNIHGQLGNGNTTNQSTPVQFILPVGKKATANTGGSYVTCALTDDQLVYCAGQNNYGQLGDSTTTNRSTPVLSQLPAGKKAVSVQSSSFMVCRLVSDQQLYCSGRNDYGQLGIGTSTNSLVPVLFQL